MSVSFFEPTCVSSFGHGSAGSACTGDVASFTRPDARDYQELMNCQLSVGGELKTGSGAGLYSFSSKSLACVCRFKFDIKNTVVDIPAELVV
jgi:hypothetical protein